MPAEPGRSASQAAQPTVREVLERAARRCGHAEISTVEVICEARAERDEELARRSGA